MTPEDRATQEATGQVREDLRWWKLDGDPARVSYGPPIYPGTAVVVVPDKVAIDLRRQLRDAVGQRDGLVEAGHAVVLAFLSGHMTRADLDPLVGAITAISRASLAAMRDLTSAILLVSSLAEPQVNPSEAVEGWPCPHRVGLSFSDPADPTGLGAYAEYVRADVAGLLAEGEESREPCPHRERMTENEPGSPIVCCACGETVGNWPGGGS